MPPPLPQIELHAADRGAPRSAGIRPACGSRGPIATNSPEHAAAPLHCIVERLYAADGGRVVLEWQDEVGLLGIDIYEIVDGRIQEQRNYFDQLSFLRLNGLPVPTE